MSITAAPKRGTARPAPAVDSPNTAGASDRPGEPSPGAGEQSHSAGPTVATVKEFASAMTTVAAKSLSQQDRRGTLADVDEAIGKLQLVRTRLIAAEDASGDWVADGDKNLETWLGRSTRSGYGPAKSDVDMSRTLEDLPIVGNAFEAGTITVEHVKAASRQYTHASDDQRDALTSSQGQQDLVTKAQDKDAGRFNKQLARDLARVDAAKLERDRASVKNAATSNCPNAAAACSWKESWIRLPANTYAPRWTPPPPGPASTTRAHRTNTAPTRSPTSRNTPSTPARSNREATSGPTSWSPCQLPNGPTGNAQAACPRLRRPQPSQTKHRWPRPNWKPCSATAH